MEITVERITGTGLMNRAFGATVGTAVIIPEDVALKSEHSPIRCLWFWINFRDIPQRVVNHLTRHKHGVEWFVATSRPDRTTEQKEMRDMSCMINAQALINISRKRLCARTWSETRAVWQEVRRKMLVVDSAMAGAMVADCE